MLEIGKPKIVPIRTRTPEGKTVFKLGADGKPETKIASSDVWRECRDELGGNFGRDKRRKLVVGLVAVDQLVLYPKGTRQEIRVNIADIYAWALRSRALRSQLERARERKEKLAISRERRSRNAKERRFSKSLKRN